MHTVVCVRRDVVFAVQLWDKAPRPMLGGYFSYWTTRGWRRIIPWDWILNTSQSDEKRIIKSLSSWFGVLCMSVNTIVFSLYASPQLRWCTLPLSECSGDFLFQNPITPVITIHALSSSWSIFNTSLYGSWCLDFS